MEFKQSWILDSTPWIPDSRYRIPDSWSVNLEYGFQSLAGFRILLAVLRIPRPRISDSKQKFPGFRYPDSLSWGENYI